MKVIKQLGVLLLLSFCLPASYLAAQEFTGRVTDTSGAVLTKAAITAHNVATNVDTATVTTASGDYTIPYLKPGNYTVSVQANGFETGLRTGLELQVGQTATVNFALNVGHATETVTVQGDSLVDFGKADIGEVVENTRVTELPLNGRDPGCFRSSALALSGLEAHSGSGHSMTRRRTLPSTAARGETSRS